jgi:AcrR family transcriptional regulator
MPERPSTRKAQKAQTRQRILEVSTRRFVADGYDAVRIADVAEEATVSVGSVHAHFTDKRGLLRACLHEDIARSVAKAWRDLDDEAALADQLLFCARTLFAGYAKHPALSRVMLSHTLFPVASGDPPDELIGPFLDRIAERYLAAAQRGEVAVTPTQAPLLAQTFFSLYLSTLIGGLGEAFGVARSARSRAQLWAAQLEPLLRLHVEGLAPRRSRRSRHA